MLGRVAVCGITAFLLVLPVVLSALPSGETNFADLDASVASVVVATSHDQIPDQILDQIPPQTEDWVRDDIQTQANWLMLVKDSEMRRVVPLFVLDEGGVTQFVPTTTPVARHASAPYKGVASTLASL